MPRVDSQLTRGVFQVGYMLRVNSQLTCGVIQVGWVYMPRVDSQSTCGVFQVGGYICHESIVNRLAVYSHILNVTSIKYFTNPSSVFTLV